MLREIQKLEKRWADTEAAVSVRVQLTESFLETRAFATSLRHPIEKMWGVNLLSQSTPHGSF